MTEAIRRPSGSRLMGDLGAYRGPKLELPPFGGHPFATRTTASAAPSSGPRVDAGEAQA
jgi:hypothetical protein